MRGFIYVFCPSQPDWEDLSDVDFPWFSIGFGMPLNHHRTQHIGIWDEPSVPSLQFLSWVENHKDHCSLPLSPPFCKCFFTDGQKRVIAPWPSLSKCRVSPDDHGGTYVGHINFQTWLKLPVASDIIRYQRRILPGHCHFFRGTAKPRRLPRVAQIPAAALQWSHEEAPAS